VRSQDHGQTSVVICYRGGGAGLGGVTVEVCAAVVEVLGHVGEGFAADLTLVQGVSDVGLPATKKKKVQNEGIK